MFRFVICVLVLLLGSDPLAAQENEPKRSQDQPQKIRKVRRVAKPKFEKTPSDVWFNDIFTEGLVGSRPDKVTSPSATTASTASSVAKGDDEASDESAFAWSKLISGTAIEDEVKTLNQQLAKSLTTPVRFKTEYTSVQQTMSLLSMSFAIIREYDADVRWKEHASAAHAALQQAAKNARSNSDQAFNYCNARKFDLEDLIRGSAFPETEKPEERLDWSEVIGRTETMIRLQQADENLKLWTADKDTFEKQKSLLVAEAQWVAAIAEVIAKEGMDDADDEDYLAFCVAMKDAAKQTAVAATNDDFDSASRFSNLVSQSCSNCHDQWR